MSFTGQRKKRQIVVFTLVGEMTDKHKQAWDAAVAKLREEFGLDQLTITWVESAHPTENVTTK
jgi:hypothetical protein